MVPPPFLQFSVKAHSIQRILKIRSLSSKGVKMARKCQISAEKGGFRWERRF